jgi:gas vesicle structural protein
MPDATAPFDEEPLDGEQLVLGDLINRVLDKGVVISGHVMISVADIDLVALDLRLLLSSVQTAMDRVVEHRESDHGIARILPATRKP